MIGADGRRLFALLDETSQLSWVHNVPAVEMLRQVWMQQFYADEQADRSRRWTILEHARQWLLRLVDVPVRAGRSWLSFGEPGLSWSCGPVPGLSVEQWSTGYVSSGLDASS